MLKAHLTGSLLAATLLLFGCQITTGTPDPEPQYLGPAVIDLSPSPGQSDFYFEDNLWALFEFQPEAAQLILLDANGSTVDSAASISGDGRLFTLDPSAALAPDSDYTMEIQVTTPDSPPLRITFRTSQHGLPIHTEAGGLGGTVFRLDTSAATVTQPTKAGPILLSQIESWDILIGFDPDSDFDAENQPAVHLQSALGRPGGEGFEQDPCSRTVSLTWGLDGVIGTPDDIPADFDDPRIELGPGDVDILVGLVPNRIGGLHFSGLVHPDLTNMREGILEGTIDTRAFDMLFSKEGGQEGITCSLLETLDIACEECGGDNPGVFCLPMQGERVRAVRVDMAPIKQHTCASVIEHFDATGECATQAALYDPQENGSYEICPEYGN